MSTMNISKMSIFFCISLIITNLSNLQAKPYGYLITDKSPCTVWWAEGVYKIKKDDPVPAVSRPEITFNSALNEYEPFQVVLRPERRMDNVRIKISDLDGSYGFFVPSSDMSICRVGYVSVTAPTDTAGRVGEWPDPLMPYDGPFTIYPDENNPLWITVYLRLGATWGSYKGTITIYSDTWEQEIPVTVNARSFTLPEETHIRSALAFWPENIKKYHNLETEDELEQVIDLYLQNYREHRISPYEHDLHHHIKYSFQGINWTGGEFTTKDIHEGKRAVKVSDNSTSADMELEYTKEIVVEPGIPYTLSWMAKAEKSEQKYTVLIKSYNQEGEWLTARNRLKIFDGSNVWEKYSFDISPGFIHEVSSITLHFYPVFRKRDGSNMGTVHFDSMVLSKSNTHDNLLENGGFDTESEYFEVECDFTDFDSGMNKYLDIMGFNAFRLRIAGVAGIFGCFAPDTPEHEKLFGSYMKQIQEHLEEKGWLGREYIYWKDEPTEDEYDWVRDAMERIHRAAPRLKRMLTEQPEPALYGAVDIWCPVLHHYDSQRAGERQAMGEEFWWYLCTGPKAPWLTLFIDHADINLRMWLWMTYKYKVQGILVWNSMWWNSTTLFPDGKLQNPWEDPMSYRMGYGTPFGQVRNWGNGDGRFLYPPNKDPNNDKTKFMCGPVNSIRWEMMRDGIEDYEYLWLLENAVKNASPEQAELVSQAKILLKFPESFIKNRKEYDKDPQVLLDYREKVGALLDRLVTEFY